MCVRRSLGLEKEKLFVSPLGRLGGTWLHLSPVKLCVQSCKIWRDKTKMPFAGSVVLQIPRGAMEDTCCCLRIAEVSAWRVLPCEK